MALAKWWKIDFHTHTPASACFKDKTVTPSTWVKAAIDKGLEAVVITDHNSGEWVEKIQAAALKEKEENAQRNIIVYPGIELCVDLNFIHVLVIFDPKAKQETVQKFITECGITQPGNTLLYVSVDKLRDVIANKDVLIVPAHFNKSKGLCSELNVNGIREFAKKIPIAAIEVRDNNDIQEVKNKIANRAFLSIPSMVTGSDNPGSGTGEHGLNFGDKYTWIKLSEHSLEGLRQAFLDSTRIRYVIDGNVETHNPNEVTNNYIAGIRISKLKHIDDIDVRFSPHLNCIIGGRGTGKSTIVEMIKLVISKLEDNQCKDKTIMKEVTSEESEIEIYYNFGIRKNYKVKVSGKRNRNWGYEDETGDIENPPEFSAQIFSQKDIYNLVDDDVVPGKRDKSPLLEIIDENIVNQKIEIEAKLEETNNKIIALSMQLRGITEETLSIPKVRGNIETIESKLAIYTDTGILDKKKILEELSAKVTGVNKIIAGMDNCILSVKENYKKGLEVALIQSNEEFGMNNSMNECFRKNITDMDETFNEAINKATIYLNNMRILANESEIYNEWEKISSEYEDALKKIGNLDVGEYKNFEKERDENKKILEKLLKQKENVGEIKKELEIHLSEVKTQYDQLLDHRNKIIENIQSKAKNILIEIVPLSHRNRWIYQLRKHLNKTDAFDDDFEMLANMIFPGGNFSVESWRKWCHFIMFNEQSFWTDTRFSERFKKMWEGKYNDKTITSFLTIWPEDKVEISIINQGTKLSLNEGSPGQKSAAVLAFIMNQGEKPLVIDQPEDDLDNSLIRELIVENIRTMKNRRQIIIVTHNANIPVIGDAEGIIMLDRNNGGKVTLKGGKKTGCIEEQMIKKGICDIMEGGIESFKLREKKYNNVDK